MIYCGIDEKKDMQNEHPCLKCKHHNTIDCPHTLYGMLFDAMKKWYGIEDAEELHARAQKESLKYLKKFTKVYHKSWCKK